MTDLSADFKALANYRPTHKVRFVTAASLFICALRIFRIAQQRNHRYNPRPVKGL